VRADEIRSVTPAAARAGQPPEAAGLPVTDVGGRAVIPGLVDAHVHLDKAYQLACLDRLGVRPGRGLPLDAVREAPGILARLGRPRPDREDPQPGGGTV
jgi:predicted amidohydrolase YtcJ